MATADALEQYILKILSSGVQKSATALFDFASEEVYPDSARYFPSADPAIQPPARFHILETRLIGDLRGTCSLAFNGTELEYLMRRLGEHFSIGNDELVADCLVEMMNIIGSPIATELSDALHVRVFLDVPVLRRVDHRLAHCAADTSAAHSFWFKSVLKSRSSRDFAPELICEIRPDAILSLRQDDSLMFY